MSFTSIQTWDVTTSFCYVDSWRRNRWNTNMIFVIITYENNLFYIVYGHNLLYITYRHNLFFLHLPRKMEPIEGSETSAFKPQTPGKYPKENILHNLIRIMYEYNLFYILYGYNLFRIM
jgi:hypothetical protein